MKISYLSGFLLFAGSCLACIEPEGEAVQLEGTVAKETFPGRPNYESIEEGDEPETYWILTTENGVCVNGFEEPQKRFQLFSYDGKFLSDLKEGEVIKVGGKTMEGFTGHHHTPVLIRVENEIKP